MNVSVNKIIAKTGKFLHNDAESNKIVRRTEVPIITFKEIFYKSRVTWTGQKPMIDNLLPKLMDRYFAKSWILEDTDCTSVLYLTINRVQQRLTLFNTNFDTHK